MRRRDAFAWGLVGWCVAGGIGRALRVLVEDHRARAGFRALHEGYSRAAADLRRQGDR